MSISEPRVRLTWDDKPSEPTPSSARLEVVEPGHPSSMLVEGDNLEALGALARRAGASVALVYLDPPFLTGRQHNRVERGRDANGRIQRSERPAFDDRWSGMHDYLGALHGRLSLARDLLAPHGSLVLHVDPKTSHYAKVMCDEIFGPECFASEIVWRYRRWPAKTKNFQRVHDVLLRYVKDPEGEPRFNQLYEPLAASTRATWGTRKQRAVTDDSGRRQRSSSTEEESPGTPLGDVWEIGIVAPVARERTGYPTQKPMALLERLVASLTDPGDLVVDPYVGSGTTLAVCAALGRRAIGIDQNREALEICKQRLGELGIAPLRERVSATLSVRKAAPASAPTASRKRLKRAS
ncbi:MAG: site-specific DNA-methyltransferase [Myxococcales bacterium]|nr:site-specific DNA-methyltransferase [Myxococcales bacterium]